MPPKKNTKAAQADGDVAMSDAPAVQDYVAEAAAERDPHNPATPPPGECRVTTLPGSTEMAASYAFEKEDHTLGNALRYIIMRNPDVEFCGYSIPHPSEAIMNIRIQTYKGPAIDALNKGLQDLEDLCEIVADTFTEARTAFVEGRQAEESD